MSRSALDRPLFLNKNIFIDYQLFQFSEFYKIKFHNSFVNFLNDLSNLNVDQFMNGQSSYFDNLQLINLDELSEDQVLQISDIFQARCINTLIKFLNFCNNSNINDYFNDNEISYQLDNFINLNFEDNYQIYQFYQDFHVDCLNILIGIVGDLINFNIGDYEEYQEIIKELGYTDNTNFYYQVTQIYNKLKSNCFQILLELLNDTDNANDYLTNDTIYQPTYSDNQNYIDLNILSNYQIFWIYKEFQDVYFGLLTESWNDFDVNNSGDQYL